MITPQQPGHPALKWGLIFGGVLALLSLINSGIEFANGTFSQIGDPVASRANMGANLLIGCGGFIVEAALYFFAGMLASRASGKVGTGALAGLIAAAVGTIVGGVISVIVLTNLSISPPPGSGVDPAQFATIMHTVFIIIAIGAIVVGLGVGSGIAALGGLVGRGQYESSHPAPAVAGSLYNPMGPQGAPYSYAPPPGYPPAGAPGAYPPTEVPSTGAPYQYPPAPGAYPPPPEAPQQPPTQPPTQSPQ